MVSDREKAAALNNLSELVVYQDMENRVIWANKAAGESVGVAAEELVGRYCYEIWHQRSEVCEGCPIVEARETGQTREAEVTTHDGRVYFLRGDPIKDANGNVVGIVEVSREITERRRAEEALRESEATLKSIFLAAPVGIGMAINRVIKQANDRLCEILGYSREELLDKEARMLYPTEEDYEFVGREKYAQIQLRGSGTVETRWQRKDGEVIEVLLSSAAINPDDISSSMIFTAVDITERKRAKEALRESEEKYRSLFDATHDAVFIAVATTGEIIDANEAASILMSIPREQIIGMHQAELHPPEEAERYKAIFAEHVQSGRAITADIYVQRPSGDRVPVDISASTFSLGNKVFVQGEFRDITKRKQLEQELIQSEKLAALGRLAAGTTHEVLNPLAVIDLTIQRLIENPTTPPEIADDLRDAKGQSERIYKILQNLLQFSRPRPVELCPIDLNEVIEQSVDLANPDLRVRNITPELKLSGDLPRILGDKDQLHLLALNLLTNARDAMPDGGEIIVSTNTVERQGNRLVELRVEDTGEGIASEDIDKLFEPFFTTKPVGEGTGLGLSVCKGIIASHGGSICAESVPGGGAAFVVQFDVEGE